MFRDFVSLFVLLSECCMKPPVLDNMHFVHLTDTRSQQCVCMTICIKRVLLLVDYNYIKWSLGSLVP